MRKPRLFSRGFTLIELLVVITIIGILAGLAFPAMNGAMNAARKAEAGAMISQLRTALTSYQTEYGTYPACLQGTTDTLKESGDLYYTLIAKDGGNNAGNAENIRRIVFMEFNNKVLRANKGDKTPADAASATLFVDPWNGVYYFKADSDYSNTISGLPGGSTINSSLAIWTAGKDTTASKTSDDIYSWK